MKAWKLVSGILSIVFAAFVMFQSSIAGIVNTIEDNGEASGSAGLIVALLMIAGGIVSIVAKNKTTKGIHIAFVILFVIAAIIGFANAGGIYKDLLVWSIWCCICAVIGIVGIVLKKRETKDQNGKEENLSE